MLYFELSSVLQFDSLANLIYSHNTLNRTAVLTTFTHKTPPKGTADEKA